ncbi:MAG: twin-arginine translocation signal domain-containing protein [Proteobacteria bacterium]|nr:twin-arginine translocation signal domain-containing protein [Pseudomonadota bacterium]MBU4580996.1 twin-arginine translocation signal domain-containing protein [Pseudomonadota bacterium]MCG2740987.1 twin-arginine translocation signal domain-containing protein [Syntrophaceae bacterium]
MGMDRRTFLKGLGTGIAVAAPGSSLLPGRLEAKEVVASKEFMGVLVDTTRCAGCQSCETACAEANNLTIPEIGNASAFEKVRDTSEKQWTLVNRFKTEKGEIFVKKQCMHCNQPGCVAACLVKAMVKRENGAVTWETNCMGCRFCMVSCPFDIPKFEYDSAVPKIQKCSLCWEKLEKGQKPACVEACPAEALTFGTRRELIEEAKRRIYQNSGQYISHIYGEHEVGGTGYLYISAVPFEQIGFRTDLGKIAYPEFSKGFLYSVPIVLLLWPAFLVGVNAITNRKDEVKRREGGAI